MNEYKSRGMLTEIYKLDQREREYITKNFGVWDKEYNKKKYFKADIIKIEEMLYWNRNAISLIDVCKKYGISVVNVSARLNIISQVPDNMKKNIFNGWRISCEYLERMTAEYPLLKEIEEGKYLTERQIYLKTKINPITLRKLFSILSFKDIMEHPLLTTVRCISLNQYNEFKEKFVTYDEEDDVIERNGKTYFNNKYASDFVGIPLLAIKELYQRGVVEDILLCHFKSTNKQVLLVNKNELIKYRKIIENTLAIEDFKKFDCRFNDYNVLKINTSPQITQVFPNAFYIPFSKFIHYRIPKEDVIDLLENVIPMWDKKYAISSESNPERLIDLLLIDFTEYPRTVDAYRKFINVTGNKHKGRSLLEQIKRKANNMKQIYECLTKEIFEYTDLEIRMLVKAIDKELTLSIKFINYLLVYYKKECRFTMKWRLKEIKRNSIKQLEDVYTFEEWAKYAVFAMDTERHIESSLKWSLYSRAWAYILFHFVAAIRKSDILNFKTLEYLNKEELNRLINKIKHEKDIDMSEAEIIISLVQDITDTTVISKNKGEMTIHVAHDLKKAFAIALIICEIHCREEGSANLFGRFGGRNLDYAMRTEEIKGFGNLKACRTLMSLVFNEANKEGGMAAYAYEISRRLRGHKLNHRTLHNDVTADYIYAINKDGDVDPITYELFRRGTFGFVFKMLADIALKDESSVNELNNKLELIKNNYSVYGIESLAWQVVRKDEMLNVLEEIIAMPVKEVKQILKDLSLGKIQGKTPFTQCLRYAKSCPFELADSCFGCRYNIPTTYSMHLLITKINSIMDDLRENSVNSFLMVKKHSYNLYRCLDVIAEFKQHFINTDKNYLDAFIDMKEIKSEMVELLKNNKLLSPIKEDRDDI